jgi:4-alpha-glucanotransferase
MSLLKKRTSGVLMHITSLPGSQLSGDLGPSAHHFAKTLGEMGQTWWQTLPIHPIGRGNSPYSSCSSFAGEPLLISPELLVKERLLKSSDLRPGKTTNEERVNFSKTKTYRTALLKKAYLNACSRKDYFNSSSFRSFRRRNAYWLGDFILFASLADRYKTKDWSRWPDGLRFRNPSTLKAARIQHADDMQYHEFCQFVFDQQWANLRKNSKKHGVQLLGDIPIFVAFESADVWAHSHYFLMDKERRPKLVSGCPPDRFAKDGQLWGTALYDWQALKKGKFDWWIERFSRLLYFYDAVRLDHFIGFYRYWAIDAKAKTAKGGRWKLAGGDDLFKLMAKKFKNSPFIAEDLGPVIPPVRQLRDRYDFPGMKVLQFSFGSDKESKTHRPHLYPKNSVVYPGTHDNNTAQGWFQDVKHRGGTTWDYCVSVFGSAPKEVHWQMIGLAMYSPANVAISPIQDILGLSGAHRMNVPGKANGNWTWRMKKNALNPKIQERLYDLSEVTDRL